jgi:glycosyltransferase involved in cell wall biosynthesis
MNILYIVHQFYPESHTGTEKFLLNLASALQRDGHFVQIVTYTFSRDRSNPADKQNLSTHDYVYRGLPITAVRHHRSPIDINVACDIPDIHRFALEYMQKRRPFDLMHIAHPMRLAPFAAAARECGIPYMVTLTDFWMMCPRITLQTVSGSLCSGPEGGNACGRFCPEYDSAFLRDRTARCNDILSSAAALVSPSKFLAAVFEKEFPGSNPRVIPHGMDFRYLCSNTKKYSDNDPVVFAYCGGMAEHKGVHLLIKAFRNIPPGKGILKLYGSSSNDTGYYSYLKKIAGSDDRIHFCGTYRNELVGEIMSDIDVLVMPSLWYENYPLVLHEALACGVPVIASSIGGMSEKIRDSVNGFTFNPGDEKHLEEKLRFVLSAPGILNHLKDTINREYLLPPVEEEAYLYDRLYKSLIGQQAHELESR